jgi:hypothetical protein
MKKANYEYLTNSINRAKYFEQIVFVHLYALINQISLNDSILLEVCNEKFYMEVYSNLNKKRSQYYLMLLNTEDLKQEFDNDITSSNKTSLTIDEMEYESLIIEAHNSISTLIKKFDIELENLLTKAKQNINNKQKENNNGKEITKDITKQLLDF